VSLEREATDQELGVSHVHAYRTVPPATWFVPGNTQKHGATGYGRALFCALSQAIEKGHRPMQKTVPPCLQGKESAFG